MSDRPVRRRRAMPNIDAVAESVGLPLDTCLRCAQIARCERAHVIDRQFDGLDNLANLVPLCVVCHKDMPPFIPGEERKAWLWLHTTSDEDYVWELAVRSMPTFHGTIAEFQYFDSDEYDCRLAAAGLAAPPVVA